MIRERCPACGARDCVSILRQAYTSPNLLAYMREFYGVGKEEVSRWLAAESYEVRECRACGMCFQVFYPDRDLAIELYDTWINPEECRRGDLRRPSISSYEPQLQEVVALAGYVERHNGVPLPQVKILDYGMGWGSWLRMACAFGVQAYGYELSPTRIQNAASLGVTCLDDAGLSEHKFHIISLDQVLEHVPDPRAVVERLVPLLHPGGLLKISVPNGKGTASALRSIGTARLIDQKLVAIRPLEHTNSFTPRSLRQLTDSFGLKVRREPVLQQFSLICGSSVRSLARSIGRPLVRGVLGVGTTSLVLSR